VIYDLGKGKYRLSVVSPPPRGGRVGLFLRGGRVGLFLRGGWVGLFLRGDWVGLMAHHFSQKQKHRMALRFYLEKRTNAGLLLVGYHILRAEMLYYYYG
jgi:hypothetical protein